VAERPDARFVVVGDGPDLSMLNALTQKLDIEENVSFVGRRGDMPGVYASLDVMVSSSRQEGLPMAILEGMASSLPLVATAVGDVPTLVLNGRTGITVPSEDVELLAAGIVRLLQDSEIRERYGNAARKLIEEQFSAEQMAADYLSVYTDAAPEKPGRENSSESHFSSAKRGEAQEFKK
jgi:glycosyltransferase involved in cell wall biosynthesis